MKQKIKNNKIKKNITKIFLVFVFGFLVFNFSVSNVFALEWYQANPFYAGYKIASTVWGSTVGEAVLDTAQSVSLLIFNYLLYGVWLFVSACIWIAGMLFDWSINPVNINGIVGSDSVYAGWTIVRDFLNLSFILVLLFSAFATVFQIDKYHLMKKNILLMVVLMALLVNFSFPVARFIIDTTNVTMYFFVEQAFPGYNYTSSSISSYFLDKSNLVNLVLPEGISSVSGDTNLTVKLLMLIVFSFLMAVTMIALAGIFLVRIVALAIIVIFAPLGFVGPIFPSFSDMGKWWSHLFNYALAGPVMMFMYLLALRLMEAGIGGENIIGGASLNRFSENYEVPGSSKLIATASSLIIPMIIMWAGILMAGKMGVYGSDKIVGFAKNMGNRARRAPGKAIGWGLGVTGVSGGAKKTKDEFLKTGNFAGRQWGLGKHKLFGKEIDLNYGGSEAQALREEKMGARMSKGKWSAGNEAQMEYERKKVNEERKKIKDQGGASDNDLYEMITSKDKIKMKVAALEMAEKNGFNDIKDDKGNIIATGKQNFNIVVDEIKNDPVLKNIFDDKVKEKRIDLHIERKIDEKNKEVMAKGGTLDERGRLDIAYEEINKMNTDKWSKQNFGEMAKSNIVKGAARRVYREMDDKKKEDVMKKISGKQLAEGKKGNIFNGTSDSV